MLVYGTTRLIDYIETVDIVFPRLVYLTLMNAFYLNCKPTV